MAMFILSHGLSRPRTIEGKRPGRIGGSVDACVYVVKAETHEGKVVTLSDGFPSRAVAEDFPVRLAKWRRVWVERTEPEVRLS